jgi:formate dehydrogenase
MPSPAAIDFVPGELLGSVSGGLGLRNFVESRGHSLVITADKDGPDAVLEKELVDADVVISQPFWPAYITADRIAKAPNLRLAITAGIGSDHVDLQAAIDRNITVCEVTYCNSISVAEHAVMQILALVRDYIPQYHLVEGRLEYRGRHIEVVRYRGDERRCRWEWAYRVGGVEAHETLRCSLTLH